MGNADQLVPEALFNQIVINKEQLISNINRARGLEQQITLAHVLEQHPLQQGLAELVVYFAIASADKHALFDESQIDTIIWLDNQGITRQANLPRIIFSRA